MTPCTRPQHRCSSPVVLRDLEGVVQSSIEVIRLTAGRRSYAAQRAHRPFRPVGAGERTGSDLHLSRATGPKTEHVRFASYLRNSLRPSTGRHKLTNNPATSDVSRVENLRFFRGRHTRLGGVFLAVRFARAPLPLRELSRAAWALGLSGVGGCGTLLCSVIAGAC